MEQEVKGIEVGASRTLNESLRVKTLEEKGKMVNLEKMWWGLGVFCIGEYSEDQIRL